MWRCNIALMLNASFTGRTRRSTFFLLLFWRVLTRLLLLQVCPANWNGGKTIKADPKNSLEYFASVPAATNGSATENGAAPKKRVRVDWEVVLNGGSQIGVDFRSSIKESPYP